MSLYDEVQALTEKVALLEKQLLGKIDTQGNRLQITDPLRRAPALQNMRDGEMRVVRENENAQPYIVVRSSKNLYKITIALLS